MRIWFDDNSLIIISPEGWAAKYKTIIDKISIHFYNIIKARLSHEEDYYGFECFIGFFVNSFSMLFNGIFS